MVSFLRGQQQQQQDARGREIEQTMNSHQRNKHKTKKDSMRVTRSDDDDDGFDWDDTYVPKVYASWPQYRGNSQNQGVSTYPGPTKVEEMSLWRFMSDSEIASTPVVSSSSGDIYVTDVFGVVYCVDYEGSLQWTYVLTPINSFNNVTDTSSADSVVPSYSSLAIRSDSSVVVVGYSGFVYTLSSEGDLLWAHNISSHVIAAPTLDYGDVTYIASGDGNVFVFNYDGSAAWSYFDPDLYFPSSPTLTYSGLVCVVGQNRENNTSVFLSFTPSDGALLFSYELDGLVTASPMVDFDGFIYVVFKNIVVVFDEVDGCMGSQVIESLSGKDNDAINFMATPSVSFDGVIYLPSTDGRLFALGEFNSTLLWEFDLKNSSDSNSDSNSDNETGSITSSPTIDVNGNVFFSGSDGFVYALSSSGSLTWKMNANNNTATTSFSLLLPGLVSPSPTIGDGILYVASSAGYLCAIGPSTVATNHSLDSTTIVAIAIAAAIVVTIASYIVLFVFWKPPAAPANAEVELSQYVSSNNSFSTMKSKDDEFLVATAAPVTATVMVEKVVLE